MQVVMVLGSGLGPIADAVQDATVIPYGDIPHFHAPGVQGHPGRLVIGYFNGVPALVLQVRGPYGIVTVNVQTQRLRKQTTRVKHICRLWLVS
jgi:purine nucleoside phosphorylase